MLGRKEQDQLKFFVCGSLCDLIPEDHVLVQVDRVLDLSWLAAEVADLYADEFGRPGIDPEGEEDQAMPRRTGGLCWRTSSKTSCTTGG